MPINISKIGQTHLSPHKVINFDEEEDLNTLESDVITAARR